MVSAMLAPVLALAMMQNPEASSLHLYNTCRSAIRMMESAKPDPRDFPGGNYCIGYITGFMDGSGTIKRGACMPDSVDGEKIIRTYVAYMLKHPEENAWDKRETLLFALADAYPCRSK
ncbi:MAG TPA: Rap1a/Tai family immunity protein [Edaphobacter sp.]|nr:Rap1a/Tai family immunity protein [Edaphobacter sp.]